MRTERPVLPRPCRNVPARYGHLDQGREISRVRVGSAGVVRGRRDRSLPKHCWTQHSLLRPQCRWGAVYSQSFAPGVASREALIVLSRCLGQSGRTMDNLGKPGRLAFAIAVAALGLQQLAYADFVPGPLIAPAWLPWRAFWAFLSGLVLFAGGVGIVTAKHARRASSLLSLLLLATVLLFHL